MPYKPNFPKNTKANKLIFLFSLFSHKLMNEESVVTLISEIAQGNWGAFSVVEEMQKEFGVAASFFFGMLKEMDLVGPRLWILYKHVAKHNIDTMMEIVMKMKVDPTYAMTLDGKETEVLSYITSFPGAT